MALNPRQLAFVEHYLADPNATQAAKKAGYRGNDAVLASTGCVLLRNPKVVALLKGRSQKASDKRIATADQIRALWSEAMQDPNLEWQHRLKASELLAKTEAMFVEKSKVEGKLDITIRRGGDAPAALQPQEDEE